MSFLYWGTPVAVPMQLLELKVVHCHYFQMGQAEYQDSAPVYIAFVYHVILIFWQLEVSTV